MSEEMPSITEAEWEVMKVLWKKSPLTANEVCTAIQEFEDWKPKTIRTLLDRLTRKQVIAVNKDKRIYTFTPLYTEHECQRAEAKSLIDRIYGGITKSLLVQFIEDETLTKEELKELKKMLDNKID
ncbi:penicillinase repressor BlaI [[Bacillus] enclensis]|uniref:penicillinase repressor BlaI n=1 Tax=[Bacillus] enclensis TaxID=1402860 RepID=UPI0018DB88DE|nr:penicillinase repressor BlaI [[Bacillus] enclensis]MBH9966186.1 penicillinase repressor BlaI [[Bacillus] enclensis]QWC23648.1 penicillinase repressor BlaI [Bacillus haikouensis]